jgi:hypothetical protein
MEDSYSEIGDAQLDAHPQVDGISPEDQSLFQKIVDQLGKPGDEDNPLKAIRTVSMGVNDRIALEGDDLPLGLRQEFFKSIQAAGYAIQRMCEEPSLFLAVFLAIVFFFDIFIGGTYLSVVSADITVGSVVSSVSPRAGLWESDISSAAFLLGDGAVIAENRQARTWAYKNACYETDEGDPACTMFYKQQIPFSSSNAPCPFDGDACLSDDQPALEVTTGLLDSNVLGVNAPASKRFYFRRTMTCAPLHADERYVTSTGGNKYPNEWLYNYGPFVLGSSIILDNYTYRNPMEWSFGIADILDYTLA